jgi:tetratricopeptide (TPR) repeat protein
MRRNLFFIWMALLAAGTISCSESAKKEGETIESLEAELFDDEAIFTAEGRNKALKLVQMYINYAEKHPEDTVSAHYLFKAADITMNLDNPSKAIDLYNKVIYTYPDFSKAPECLFLVAYIYENHLENYGKAKELYEMFIERYPDNDFADDAAISIRNMGKSPEELIREFERQNEAAEEI